MEKTKAGTETDLIGGAAAAAQTGDFRLCLSSIEQIIHSGKYEEKNKWIWLTDSEKLKSHILEELSQLQVKEEGDEFFAQVDILQVALQFEKNRVLVQKPNLAA